MKSSATSEFWQLYRELPEPIKREARRTYQRWNRDPRSSALRFKKVRDAYSIRIGTTGYRAIAPGGFLWIWIGPHDAYERPLEE